MDFRRSEYLKVDFQMWYQMVRVKLWITLMAAKVVEQKAIEHDIELPAVRQPILSLRGHATAPAHVY